MTHFVPSTLSVGRKQADLGLTPDHLLVVTLDELFNLFKHHLFSFEEMETLSELFSGLNISMYSKGINTGAPGGSVS